MVGVLVLRQKLNLHVTDQLPQQGWRETDIIDCTDKNQRRRNVTTSMVGLKNGHIRKTLTQNGNPQRHGWGTHWRKEEEEEEEEEEKKKKKK